MEKEFDLEKRREQTRRRRLAQYIKEKYGTQSAYVASSGEHQGAISGLINGTRPFGSKKARAIEISENLEQGYLDYEETIKSSYPETFMARVTSDELALLNGYRISGEEGKLRILQAVEVISRPSFPFEKKA